jgi:hypothetical protein
MAMGNSMSKLSLSRAWEETVGVIARDGRLFLAVALALFVLPGLILNVSMPSFGPEQLPPMGPWILVAIAAVLVSLIGQIAVIRLAMEPHVAVGEAITHALARLFPYVAALLIWTVPLLLVGSALYGLLEVNQTHPSVVAAVALIVLCFVGAFVAVRLMLSSAVASAENIGPLSILRRSWKLSAGNWWRLFVFLLLFAIGALCLLWAVGSVVGLLVRMVVEDAGPRSIGGLIISIISQLVSALLSVGFFVMLARIYVQRSENTRAQVIEPKQGI